MDRKELEIIVKEGEGYKIEFKEGISGLEKELVAFANASGGKVILGVTDDGRIKGIKLTQKLKSQIQDIANNCRPRIKISTEDFDNVLIINVREGEDKPYECSSGFYKRIGPNSQKMTRNEILEFFKSEGKIRFDELIEPKFSYPKDFDKNGFKRFLQLAEISKIGDIERLLNGLGVAEKQEGRFYFNNAGILFFGKNPQRFVPWSVFTVALFKDDAGVDIIDRKEIEGSLFDIVEEVMKFVRLYAKVAYRFTGRPQRENIYEYPFDAIREAVINSVMHKYYFEHGHNNILRFLPDRIRIENYWQKPAHFVLGKTVFRRNHIIADLFAKIHFGEKMGTGFERIREVCKKENAPFPEIEFDENYFYVTFRQSHEYLKLAEKEKRGGEEVSLLNERQRKAVAHVNKHKFVTISEYIALNKVSDKTARRDLNDIVEKGIFIKEGATTGLKFKLTSVNFGHLRSGEVSRKE
jgi:ATP-dependent DNA helicase RecG